MRKVEMYIGYVDRTWETKVIEIPEGIDEDKVEAAAKDTLSERLNFEVNDTKPEVAFFGVYHVPKHVDKLRTEDGVEFGPGDRIFNYYDLKWGVVHSIEGRPWHDNGWFTLKQDDGSSASLDGSRVAWDLPSHLIGQNRSDGTPLKRRSEFLGEKK